MKKYRITLPYLFLVAMLTACGTSATDSTTSQGGGGGGDSSQTSSGQSSSSSQGGGGESSQGGGEQSSGSQEDYSYSYQPYEEDGVEYIYNGEQKQQEKHDPITVKSVDYVKVFVPKQYTHIYAWQTAGGKDTQLLGAWPGKAMAKYNDYWNTYDFEKGKTSFNVIFSANGGSQTADLTINGEGNWWYDGSALAKSNTEPEISAGSPTAWQPKKATNIYVAPKDYVQPSYIPKPSYMKVTNAKDYSELPVVRAWNKNSQINPYKGKRDDFRDESIYFAITTRFYDGDKSNNTHCWDANNDAGSDPNWRGDFKGLINKMDYIKAQGFTAIWITPIVKNASGFDYHGYHAINFKEVDPRYESEDVSFQTVINEAHKRDMKIVLDIVLNHTSNFGEENLFPMFYYDAKHNTSFNGMVRNKTETGILPDAYDTTNNPGQMRFDYLKTDTGDKESIYHHDPDGSLSWEQYSEQTGQIAGDCVDLNTENPTVANYLVEAYAKFIHMGVDAFRIDTVKHLSRLSLNKYYFPAFKEIAKKCGNPNFFMFGEVCVKDTDVWNRGQQSDSTPFYTWGETKNYAWGDMKTNAASAKQHWSDYLMPTNHQTSDNAYLRSGLQYHAPDHSKASGSSVIDFPMHWNFDRAGSSFGVAVNNDSVYNDATYNVVYVDSHDYAPNENQTKRYVNGTAAWKENMSLMFTFRGIPCIYYGSEIEFMKGAEIDKGPNLALAESGRAYFGDEIEGNVNVTGFGQYSNASGKMANTLNATLSKHLQKLNAIRLQVPALRRGQYTTSNYNGSGMGFTRRYTANGTDSIAAIVISGSGSFSGLPSGTYKEMYSGGTANVSNGSLGVSASGQGNVQIWVKQ